MHTDALKVAVVGAGIGGLTAALALADRGIEVEVFEQAHELKALGAGVAIATNGMRVMEELGLAPAITEAAGGVTHWAFLTADGEPLGSTTPTTGDPERTRFVHRGDVQQILADALPAGSLRLGKRLVGVEESADGVEIAFADGTSAHADVLIGADGIHSHVQGIVSEPTDPVSEGIMAYRGLVPSERVREVVDLAAATMWAGPGQSFLVYPVAGGRLVNVVAFVPTDLDVEESWTAPGDVAALTAAYDGWDPRIAAVTGAMDETFRWGIYDREPMTRWSTERVTLLGDSAHAVTPHLGQGANQAIEDAATLAELLADATAADVPTRLRHYEDLRLDRTRLVREQARAAGRIYRETEADGEEQARKLQSIYDRVEIDTYDAGAVARAALAS